MHEFRKWKTRLTSDFRKSRRIRNDANRVLSQYCRNPAIDVLVCRPYIPCRWSRTMRTSRGINHRSWRNLRAYYSDSHIFLGYRASYDTRRRLANHTRVIIDNRERVHFPFDDSGARWGEQRRCSLLLPGLSRRRTRAVPFCRIFSYRDSNYYGSPLLVNISNISRRTFCRAFSARDGRFCRRNKFTREKTNQRDRGIMQLVLLARIYVPPLQPRLPIVRDGELAYVTAKYGVRLGNGTPTNAMNMVISIIYPAC